MANYSAHAYHLGKHLSISRVIHKLDYSVIKTEQEFALFELGQDSWCYVKNYGSIVFLNVPENKRAEITDTILDDYLELLEMPAEEFEVVVDSVKEIKAEHGVIIVPQLSIDVAHVLCINLAQSVALVDFLAKSEKLLEQSGEFSEQLVKYGKIGLSRKSVRQMIGATMQLKNKVSENLYVFDTPDVAWSDETLSTIDFQMNKELEIERRHHGLQLSLATIKENLDLYQNILQHRHSSTLEWIIILLILFEILQVLF